MLNPEHTKSELESVASLAKLNQIDEIEQYGNEPRVRAKAAGTWMELEIRPYTLAEIDTDRFWTWLDKAAASFLGKPVGGEVAVDSSDSGDDPKEQTPWRVLKQRWHSIRKGFPPGKEIVWPAETLSVFIQAIHHVAVGGKWRWDEPTQARYYLPGQSEPWIILHTKRPEGLIAVLNGPAGYDPGSLKDSLPSKLHVTNRGEGEQQLQIAFTSLQQPRDASFKKLLMGHKNHVSNATSGTTAG